MVLLKHISIALTAAVAAVGSALFIALNYFYRRRRWSPEVEYSMIKEEEEGPCGKRQVLVLGLDGAGKSSMMQGLTPTDQAKRGGHRRPTRGFNFMSIRGPTCQLDFLESHQEVRTVVFYDLEPTHDIRAEVGGGEDLRRYWSEYLLKTHVLVYVVDSSDRSRLPLAKAELHRLLKVDAQLPVVVLGNKQDKPDALTVSELHTALSLEEVGGRRLFLLAAQLACDSLGRFSQGGAHTLQTFHDLLLQLV